MIIQEISFGMSVEVYPSQWRKASVKGIVGERESDAEALTQAKNFLEDWFNKAYSLPLDANKVYTSGGPYEEASIQQANADAEFEQFKKDADAFLEPLPNEADIIQWLKNTGWFFAVPAKNYIKSKIPDIKL